MEHASIAKMLRKRRIYLGHSQHAAGRRMGVAAQSVRRWEGGSRVAEWMLARVAEYLGVPVEQLDEINPKESAE